MRYNARVVSAACLAAGVCLASAQVARAQYDPPATYYNNATGTGDALKLQLRTIVSTMTARTYGDARYSAIYTDPDPNPPAGATSNILLIYNRGSVSSEWIATGTPTKPILWNREHMWPQSRLGANADNDVANVASDQFNLRPADDGINSTRGNLPYGFDSATGTYGTRGSNLWYPGDADTGDIARSLFYMTTRWSQLTLTDATPSGTQMGDLSSLITWNYRDVPDSFERRRNHAIYGLAGVNSPAITNPYKQQNRNPYVDHPEYVWSVFKDQLNDSSLSIGTGDINGASAANLNFGRVLVGGAVPAAQDVTLNKSGLAGTYYSVTTAGAATSTVSGRYNAFPIITSGTSTKLMTVGLDTTTTTAGLKSGTVTVDNLDITTGFGAGHGASDANDIVNLSLSVLSHANGTFASDGSDSNTLNLNFGTLARGTGNQTLPFSISNILATAGFTSGLQLTSAPVTGNVAALSANLSTFDALVAGGASDSFLASLNTSTVGNYATTYTINLSDENLSGAQSNVLILNLSGVVSLPKGTWLGGSGNWSNAANWGMNVVPNDSTFNVKLDDGNTATASVDTVDTNATIGNIQQDAGDTLNINATRTLTIAGTSASSLTGAVNNNGSLSILAGNATLSGGGTHTGTFTVASGAILNFAGGAHTVGATPFAGAGAINLSAGSLSAGAELQIGNSNAGAKFNQTGGTFNAAKLTVGSASGSGTFTSTAGTFNVSDIDIAAGSRVVWARNDSLSVNTLATAGSGVLDLTNSAMVIKSSNLSAVAAMIVQGYNNGDWLGGGINSSTAHADPTNLTAIGFASNGDFGLSGFEGVTGLDGDDILVKYTYYGDADLNGFVDADDFNAFLAGFQDASLARTWIYGDFDYNHLIDADDFNLFLAAYQANGAPLSTLMQSIEMSSLTLADQQTLLGAVAAVPEPGSIGLLAIAAGSLLTRRRCSAKRA